MCLTVLGRGVSVCLSLYTATCVSVYCHVMYLFCKSAIGVVFVYIPCLYPQFQHMTCIRTLCQFGLTMTSPSFPP